MKGAERDNVWRMLREARNRIYDADILSQSLRSRSDSDAIIRILAFEVLLKCVCRVCDQRSWGHDYLKLWKGLSNDVREEILSDAKPRMAGHTDFTDVDRLLKAYQKIFEKGRYFYEFYENCPYEDQRQKGEEWIGRGATVEEADLQYYPNELTCFVEAMDAFIERRLGD